MACATTYLAIQLLSANDTISLDMPTERVLRSAYEHFSTQRLFDVTTGKELSNVVPEEEDVMQLDTSYVPGTILSPSVSAPIFGLLMAPDLNEFIRVGHMLWVLFLGLMGSLVAGFLFRSAS